MRRNLIKKGRGERKKKILWFLFSHLEILDREIVYSWAYPFLPNSIPFYDVGWLSPFQKKQGREKNKKRKKRKGGQWKEKWGEKIRGKKKKGGRIDTRVWHEFTCSLYTLGSDLFWIWDFLLSRSVARALGTVVCLRWWPSRNWSRSYNNDTVLYYHCTRWTALHGSLPDRIRNWTRIALLPGHQHPYAAKSNVFFFSIFVSLSSSERWKFLREYNNVRTMRKLYPIQRPVHPCGQSGIFNDWLCTANTFAGTSHTTHLYKTKRKI